MEKDNQIFGIRAIIEAINSNTEIDRVFIQQDSQGDLMRELMKTLKAKQVNYAYVPAEKLNRMTPKNHQGAIAVVSPIAFAKFEDMVDRALGSGNPIFLLLDQISDARNFGAIIRTAACTGVAGIVIPASGSAPVNGDTVKTSAGGVFNVPIAKVNHLKDAIFYLQGSGVKCVAATEKADDTLYQTDLSGPVAIIMGSEDRGINPSILKITDARAKLPMLGSIASLNVSVACGVFLYEAIRQRTS